MGSLGPRASEGLLGDGAGDTRSWGHPELGTPRTQGRAGDAQSRGHSELWEPPGLHCTRNPSTRHAGISSTPSTIRAPSAHTPHPAASGSAAAPVPKPLLGVAFLGSRSLLGSLGQQEQPGLAPGSARPGEELVVDSRHSPAQMGLNYLKCFSRELALAV